MSATSQTLRCGRQLVTLGDSTARVAHICGAPDFRDPWIGNGALGPPLMEWTYNSGPQQLIQVILFRGDRVVDIGTGGYGFNTDGRFPPSGSCEPGLIHPGLSKYRLLNACGPPISNTGWYVLSSRLDGLGYRIHRSGRRGPLVFRERWTYNFGDNRFIRYVTMDNARVTDVARGKRGFDR
ncbi:DUF2845 domain-containing protein [Salinisphaera sp. Q1T1-3]|uniref:DUF2845 domain-containing protein n=1 Tax=Salinisphaera sp. Q1T1-3 TaxID=2321229 RepID=UPI001F43A2C6|nr:DUF2845 domain-containing protein [Salinisphaera sp. Q1T1-3]